MIVYCFTNAQTGERYVGMTTKTLSKRWDEHVHNALVKHVPYKFHRAIAKYGKDAFVGHVLQECDDHTQLASAEIAWIAKLDSLRNGYNMTSGGDGVIGYTFTQEAKARIGAGHRGLKRSVETKQKLSAQKLGANNPNFGKRTSDAVRAKLSEASKRVWASRNKIANVTATATGADRIVIGVNHGDA